MAERPEQVGGQGDVDAGRQRAELVQPPGQTAQHVAELALDPVPQIGQGRFGVGRLADDAHQLPGALLDHPGLARRDPDQRRVPPVPGGTDGPGDPT